MSDAESPIPPLPDAKTFLEGKDGIKPLQHKAEALTQFATGFEEVPLAPKAAEMVVQLGEVMKKPHWATAHDAAQDAIHAARKLVTQNPPEDLSKLAYMVESVGNARAPHVDTVKGIKHPVLEEALKPLVSYLEEFGNFISGWAGLSPSRMRPKGEDAITPAAHRAKTQAALDALKAANPDAKIPECGDANCTIDHSAPTSKPLSEAPPAAEAHLHGPGCNHDHHTAAPLASNNGHVHGPDCGHAHEHSPTKVAWKEAVPKGNAAKWVLGGLGVAAIGAFFVNLLGKNQAGASTREQEKAKGDEQKANDIAYTINHALSCGTTDVVLQPVIAATFGINVGCNHPGHTHGKQKLTWKSFAHEAGHYFKGEIIGDFAAVPLTIGVQRLFPDFMNGLRKLLEPAFGWAFRLGANHTAMRWAKKQGIAPDAPEVQAHADVVYEHEISHLPQAAVWNMFAYPIGAFAQKAMGHGVAYGQIFKSKLVGAAVSNGILIGGRMIAPGAAQKWDEFTSDKLFLPVSKTVGRVLGVDEKTMEKAAKRQNSGADGQWQDRLEELKQPTQRNL